MKTQNSVFKKKLQLTGEYEVCDVTVYERMRLRPSLHGNVKTALFKSIHFGKRFRTYAFRIT